MTRKRLGLGYAITDFLFCFYVPFYAFAAAFRRAYFNGDAKDFSIELKGLWFTENEKLARAHAVFDKMMSEYDNGPIGEFPEGYDALCEHKDFRNWN